MRYSFLPACACAFLVCFSANAQDRESINSPSGEVRIIGGEYEEKSVAVGNQTFPLGDLNAGLVEMVGNLVLVAVYTGGRACPASFHWLDTTPENVRLSESFGTCSDSPEISSDSETVTVTLPSLDASEGLVAFIYDGKQIERRVLGLASSDVAQAAQGNPDAWIGQSPYEYLTAAEHEPSLIAAIGWDSLDALRNTIQIGTQEMVLEGNWVVGMGCKPQNCDTDYGAMAIHRGDGSFIAALKENGVSPVLLGQPAEALPPTLRSILTGG